MLKQGSVASSYAAEIQRYVVMCILLCSSMLYIIDPIVVVLIVGKTFSFEYFTISPLLVVSMARCTCRVKLKKLCNVTAWRTAE